LHSEPTGQPLSKTTYIDGISNNDDNGEEIINTVGVKFNVNKTKELTIDLKRIQGRDTESINIRGTEAEQVNRFLSC